jgi:hypothetical protein
MGSASARRWIRSGRDGRLYSRTILVGSVWRVLSCCRPLKFKVQSLCATALAPSSGIARKCGTRLSAHAVPLEI